MTVTMLAAFIAFVAPLLLGASTNYSGAAERVEVIDGDTVRVGAQTYRLVGFNTPEPGMNAKCEAERALAARATFRLRQLVAGGALEFTRVPCACRPGTEGTKACNYGRACGVLKVRGTDVAEIMVAEGLAEPYVCGRTSCPRRASWCG